MKTNDKTTWRSLLGLAVAVLALAYALWHGGSDARVVGPARPPALFAPRTACVSEGDPAARADTLLAMAQAKLDRYAFDLREGPTALSLLSEAVRCHEAAQRGSEAAVTRAKLQRELQRVEADYQRRHLRLLRALAAAREDEARHEARALLELLAGQRGPYVAWLQNTAQGGP